MVTAAVLGAAVGVGTALVLTLTLLIYRYHASQKKCGLDRSWSERDSWSVPAYKSTAVNNSSSGSHRQHSHRSSSRSAHSKQLYLPLNLGPTQKFFTTDTVQPPLPSLTPRGSGGSGVNIINMSGSGSSGTSPGPATSAKRSSPLTYFSLDIPSNLLGGTSASLPHQSSLPFVSRLIRTPSDNSAEQHKNQDHHHPQQLPRRESIGRSPSPSCRHRLPSSPTPATAAANHHHQHHLSLTPYPSPMVSPTPSFSSLLSCLASSSSSCNSPVPPANAAGQQGSSPLIRNRSRSPMLAKMNSIQSSTSTNSNQSLGSTTSLFCPPATPTPLGALQPELYKRETTIHVGLDEESLISNDAASSSGPESSSESLLSRSGSHHNRPVLVTQRSSIGSGSGGRNSSAVPLGRLHFRLSYDFDKSDLLVHIVEVRDVQMAGMDCGSGGAASGSTSSSGGSVSSTSSLMVGTNSSGGSNQPSRDAHVRLTIQPEVDQRRRQSVRSIRLGQDAHCTFDECFKFPVSHDQLSDKTLRFQVCEFDRFSRPCVIGDLQFSLAEREVGSSDHPVDIWAEMMRNTLPDETRPQLLISLSYLPSAERLTVVVLKAKNLVVPANKENIDPLVKLYLMVNGKRLKKKKTECRRGTSQPVWNQALTFTVPSPKLNSCTLEIAVVDHGSDRGGKSALLGCISLGSEGSPSTPERQHWQDMAHNVRKSIAMWHFLK